MTELQRAKADRAVALEGLRQAQAQVVRLEAQLARSLRQTEQVLGLARQALADRLYARVR